MTIWICATCGIEHPDTETPPKTCAICSDERQYVPAGGQQWTTLAEQRADHAGHISEVEPDLYAVTVTPGVGIGQRAFLVRTPGGNLLWEPPGHLDDALLDGIRQLGGMAAITSSHPHLTGASISYSHAFGGVPVYYGADDRRWIRRPDDVITLWSDKVEPLPGLTLVQCGGHFPGSAVLHWAAGAGGRGVLLTGDTMLVGSDRRSVSFMRSFPNRIPLSERLVRKVVEAVEPWRYDRIYSGFDGGVIETGAAAVVRRSAERYIGWIRDDIRDPDERL